MPIIKKREIEQLEQMNGEELEKYFTSLPFTKEQIEALFEYIEDELYEVDCDHTSRFALQFMMKNNLPFPKIIAWLNANGGYCDCKIMENIEKEWRKAFPEDE
ncbi:MAG TPA: DUF2695 domain-containing protein [Pyrinomonadaceae bacterium]|nr:DUF2695 domain-containing protein [Pyrinomonadaceae bacterium]